MIYLMRHGQDDERYIGGWSNNPLIYKGINEVKDSAFWIKNNLKIKKIISSDIQRAKDTALIINKEINVDISYNDFFREQNKGLLNGMNAKLAYFKYQQFLDNLNILSKFPSGESLYDLYQKIQNNLDKILTIDDDTLIITHRGVINMLYYILNNIELDMNKKRFNVDTASVHELNVKKKKIRRVW